MKKSHFFYVGWIWCSVLLLAFSHFILPQAYSATEYEIAKIKTAGNRRISSSEILSKVRSRAGQIFDDRTATEDARRIAELAGVDYAYYNTNVVGGKIELTYVVVERNIIRSISFVGNHKYKASRLRKKMGLKTGEHLDAILVEAGREAVAEYYRKKGFAFAKVNLDSTKLPYGRLLITIEEGPRVKITSVKLSGNNNLKTKSLKKVLKVKKRRYVFLQGYYIEEKLAADVKRLGEIYYERGFLNAGVTVNKQFSPDKSRVDITYEIVEGPVYSVDKIVITGNSHYEQSRLRSELKLQAGQVYNEQKAQSDTKRLLKLYRENGFIDADVEQRREFVSEDKVDVEIEINEGGRFRIGSINITGNKDTQDKVIRRVLDEYDFKPGQWYNADTARGDGRGYIEKLVRQTVLTESATINPSGELPGIRDADVVVVEGQTGMIMLGAGLASDSGVIGQIVFEQRNFDIKNWPGSLREFITGRAFKGAGQSLRIALEPGTRVSEYSISFREPYLRDKPISLDVIGSSYARGRESYDEERLRGYVGFEKRYKDLWRRSISFRAEDVGVEDIESDAPKEIKAVKGGNAIFGVRFGAGRDLTDDRFNPSEGYKFNAGYEQVGGDHTFGILSGTHRWYKTLHEDLAERKTILGTKLHAATILGDAPPFEKFYAGGSNSIRGFDYRGVSTRGLQTNVPAGTAQREDPIGSDWIFLANAELLVPWVGENLGALFFIDSGFIDSGNYRVSVGTGIQILLPQWFGPVPMRFELAVPVMKDDDDDTQVFSFSIGRLF